MAQGGRSLVVPLMVTVPQGRLCTMLAVFVPLVRFNVPETA